MDHNYHTASIGLLVFISIKFIQSSENKKYDCFKFIQLICFISILTEILITVKLLIHILVDVLLIYYMFDRNFRQINASKYPHNKNYTIKKKSYKNKN